MSLLVDADTIGIHFTAGLEVAPEATLPVLTFTLLSNGEIQGQFDSGTSPIVGVGVATPFKVTTQDYSFPWAQDTSWGANQFGDFISGFVTLPPDDSVTRVTTSGTWTIGSPGLYSSVLDLFSPNSAGYDAIIVTTTGYHVGTFAPVPLPGAFWLVLSGLMAGVIFSRRRSASRDHTRYGLSHA